MWSAVMFVAAHMPENAASASGGAYSLGRAEWRAVAQARRVRDEVEDVVGVQVADHDRVDVRVVDVAAQLGEHAGAAVEQHGRCAGPACDEVAGAGAVGVLPRG